MKIKLDCDALDLLDEVYSLSLAVVVDERKALKLIDDLRHCADEARDSGMPDLEQRMRKAADKMQARLAAK